MIWSEWYHMIMIWAGNDTINKMIWYDHDMIMIWSEWWGIVFFVFWNVKVRMCVFVSLQPFCFAVVRRMFKIFIQICSALLPGPCTAGCLFLLAVTSFSPSRFCLMLLPYRCMYGRAFRCLVGACVFVSLILIRRARPSIGVRVYMWVCINVPTTPGTSFRGTLFLTLDSKVFMCVFVYVCICVCVIFFPARVRAAVYFACSY